jgi:hypothetical protein
MVFFGQIDEQSHSITSFYSPKAFREVY